MADLLLCLGTSEKIALNLIEEGKGRDTGMHLLISLQAPELLLMLDASTIPCTCFL